MRKHLFAISALTIGFFTMGSALAKPMIQFPMYDMEAAFKKHPNIEKLAFAHVPAPTQKLVGNWIHLGVSAPVDDEGNTYYAFACKPHDCGANQINVIWTKDETQAWTRIVVNGKATLYNNPSSHIATALTGQGQ